MRESRSYGSAGAEGGNKLRYPERKIPVDQEGWLTALINEGRVAGSLPSALHYLLPSAHCLLPFISAFCQFTYFLSPPPDPFSQLWKLE